MCRTRWLLVRPFARIREIDLRVEQVEVDLIQVAHVLSRLLMLASQFFDNLGQPSILLYQLFDALV